MKYKYTQLKHAEFGQLVAWLLSGKEIYTNMCPSKGKGDSEFSRIIAAEDCSSIVVRPADNNGITYTSDVLNHLYTRDDFDWASESRLCF